MVGIEALLADLPNFAGGAVEHRGGGVSAQAAVAMLGGVSVQERLGPPVGVVDVLEPVGAVQVIFDGFEQ